jgi:hypothetical protein
MTALATFLATAKRIEDLLGDIPRARALPDTAASSASDVEIRPYHYDDKRPALLNCANAARAIKERLMAERRAEGEAARDARLAEIAAELNALRAILPQQAAAVAIELGHQARMLQHEAQGGTT